MPRDTDLAAAASSIFNASQIISSSQVIGRVWNVPEEDIRELFTRLMEVVQHQNQALESLRVAVEKLVERLDQT